ncbi:hypothetical protein, partial [Burkholderia mallei]
MRQAGAAVRIDGARKAPRRPEPARAAVASAPACGRDGLDGRNGRDTRDARDAIGARCSARRNESKALGNERLQIADKPSPSGGFLFFNGVMLKTPMPTQHELEMVTLEELVP